MTVKECYELIGGDYENVVSRFKSDALIKRFLPMFLGDPSFSELSSALDADNVQTAFRAAHTLKGVCANLSLAALQKSSSEITEMLRAENLAAAKDYYINVKADYEMTYDTLTRFKSEM